MAKPGVAAESRADLVVGSVEAAVVLDGGTFSSHSNDFRGELSRFLDEGRDLQHQTFFPSNMTFVDQTFAMPPLF